MNKKLIIFLIAISAVMICVSPAMATESQGVTFSFLDGLFGVEQLDVSNLIIEKEKYEHTDANGKVDKKTNYYLDFKINGESDISDSVASITTYDKNNTTLATVNYTINSVGDYRIDLKKGNIDHADIIIKNKDGNVVFNNTTSSIKKTNDITKDEPVEKKTTSSSGATYWASAKSDKFHNPGCEWAQKISSKNKVVFHSRDEAISSGYRPCEVCNP